MLSIGKICIILVTSLGCLVALAVTSGQFSNTTRPAPIAICNSGNSNQLQGRMRHEQLQGSSPAGSCRTHAQQP
ncbi:hypothetical protein V8C43DRAFT_100078 [Trichoderma afarasin]